MSVIQQFMKNYDCPVEATLDVIGGKWKGIILSKLLRKTLRYNEIKRLLPKITARTLTRQLRELEADGLISRKVYAEVPPKVEYSITELGLSLEPIVKLLNDWGEEHIETVLQHRASNEAQTDAT